MSTESLVHTLNLGLQGQKCHSSSICHMIHDCIIFRLYVSMPSLLEHSVVEPTKHRFLLNKLMYSNSFFLGLSSFAYDWLDYVLTKSGLYYISQPVICK